MSNETKESMLNLVFFKSGGRKSIVLPCIKEENMHRPVVYSIQYRAYSDFSLTR